MCFFGEILNTITLSLLTCIDISVDWISNEPCRTKVLQITDDSNNKRLTILAFYPMVSVGIFLDNNQFIISFDTKK